MTILCGHHKPWLIEYWTQVTFILLALGYVIKTICGQILKQKEITYGQVTQNKIIELKNYVKCYNNIVLLLKDYYYISGQNQKEKLTEIKEKVYKGWIDFITSYSTLRIFLKKSDYALYDEVKSNLEEIQKRIIGNEIDIMFGTIEKDNIKKLWEIMDEIFPKKLPELINKIEDSLKKDMGID